jgi:hypothetical protein
VGKGRTCSLFFKISGSIFKGEACDLQKVAFELPGAGRDLKRADRNLQIAAFKLPKADFNPDLKKWGQGRMPLT